MYKFNPNINKGVDGKLFFIIKILHKNFGITPNQLSYASLLFSLFSAGSILLGNINIGLVFIVISLLFDGLDGPMARIYKYKYDLEFGEKLDIVIDRVGETVIFIACAMTGLVSFKLAMLALFAIFLMTSLKRRSTFDPGFKRTVLLVGPFFGFSFAMNIIFWVNLIGFIISLLIIDYKFQIELDKK